MNSFCFVNALAADNPDFQRQNGLRESTLFVALCVEIELAIERGDAEELDELLFAGTDLEGLWGTEAFLQVLRRKLDSNAEARRNVFSNYAKYAARHAMSNWRLHYCEESICAMGTAAMPRSGIQC